MSKTFYFYDLETSGINPPQSRIMQFAGQRTDLDLKSVGEPNNFLIKMTPEILPDPEAILVTGITPQTAISEGINETEFLKYFYKNIAITDTIFVGYNNIRFDDEFIRYLNYRNFYDAYEWQWQDSRSRWDILDLVRMTRALRPEGIKWPFNSDGKASNRLELLSAINKLDHSKAHDASSDVIATIAVAKMIKQNQPKLYEYLLDLKSKKSVEKLVNKSEPFVYSSGRYNSNFEKTTVAVTLMPHPVRSGSVLVYDLRFDPTLLKNKKPEELAELLQRHSIEEKLPVKLLSFNRCPAIAPLSVLDKSSQERLKLDLNEIKANARALLQLSDFIDNIKKATLINEKLKQTPLVVDVLDVDSRLYDGFFNDHDKSKMKIVREAGYDKLADLHLDFDDTRLDKLLLLYKARQFPDSLSVDEQKSWNNYKEQKLLSGEQKSKLVKYFEKIESLYKTARDQQQKYLLEELKLYGESIAPVDF